MSGLSFKAENGGIIFIFLWIVGVLTTLAFIAATIIYVEMRSQSLYTHEQKAFYAAESGLEIAMGEMNNGGSGTINGLEINNIVINTTNDGDTLLTSDAATAITARSLQIKFKSNSWPEPFYNVASSFNPSKELKFDGHHTPYLSGKVYSNSTKKVKLYHDYDIDTEKTAFIIPKQTKFENHSSYSVAVDRFPRKDPPYEFPSFNRKYYDDYISNVNGYAHYPKGEIKNDLDLSTFTDGVLYVHNKDLKIKSNVEITGPGVIVSKKKIIVEKKVKIGPNVRLIAQKDLEIKDEVEILGMGSILYSSEKVKIKEKKCKIYGCIISPKNVEIDPDATFSKRGIIQGIIYCGTGGKAKISHAIIYGSVVAYAYDGDKIHCTYMIFDEDYLPPLAPGFSSGSDQSTIVDGSWKTNL